MRRKKTVMEKLNLSARESGDGENWHVDLKLVKRLLREVAKEAAARAYDIGYENGKFDNSAKGPYRYDDGRWQMADGRLL